MQETLLARFSNEEISDQLSRLCEDGSKKFRGFVLPALLQMQRENREDASTGVRFLCASQKSWFSFVPNFTPLACSDS